MKLAADDATLRIEPLDEPEDVPPRKKNREFVGALSMRRFQTSNI